MPHRSNNPNTKSYLVCPGLKTRAFFFLDSFETKPPRLFAFLRRFVIITSMKPLSLSKPHLIIMVGIPGSGKSFFAEHFADTFKAPLVSTGIIRSKLFSTPTFSKDENEIISQVFDYMLNELFKTKQTIIFDGFSHSRLARLNLTKEARKNGYESLLVWTQTESNTARARATKRTHGKVALTPELFDQQIKQFTSPGLNEKVIVISGMHTFASQLKIVLKKLAEPRGKVDNQTGARQTDISSRYVSSR